jgi:hypothetical protein
MLHFHVLNVERQFIDARSAEDLQIRTHVRAAGLLGPEFDAKKIG